MKPFSLLVSPRALAGLLALCGAALAAPAAHADFNWKEGDLGQGDAGQKLKTANIVIGPGDLNRIDGKLRGKADLYLICLTGSTFTARTNTLDDGPGVVADTQLFLFDINGNGVISNDDINDDTSRSRISIANPTKGFYYLGISAYNYDPLDAAENYLFPDDYPGQFGPNPGVGPLDGWANRTLGDDDFGKYRIRLNGAAGVNSPTHVPEPGAVATGIIAGSGLLLGLYRGRRRKG